MLARPSADLGTRIAQGHELAAIAASFAIEVRAGLRQPCFVFDTSRKKYLTALGQTLEMLSLRKDLPWCRVNTTD